MSDSDKNVQFNVTANAAAFQDEMQKVATSAREASAKVSGAFDEVGGAFKRVTGLMAGFTAILAGGAGFAAAISATKQWGSEVGALSKQLGVSTTEATAFRVATERLGISSDVLTGANDKLAKSLQKNEAAYRTLGIETKNANGAWKTGGELLPDVIEKLRAIDNPMQQAIAGQQIFGKSWGEMRPLLKLTADQMDAAREKVERLHLAVNPAQVKAYKEAMNDVGLVTKSMELQIGTRLIPVMTQLGKFMGEQGPSMGDTFATMLQTVVAVAETAWLAIQALGKGIGGVAAAIVEFASGNFRNAAHIMGETFTDAVDMGAKIRDVWTHAYDKPEAPKAEPHETGDQGGIIDFGKEAREKAAASRMAGWETVLQEDKAAYALQNEGREKSKEDELAYWEALKGITNLSDQELNGIKRKSADLKLAILKEQHAQEIALTEQAISEIRSAEMHAVEMEKLDAQAQLDAGQISREQMLVLEKQFEDRRTEISRQALLDRRAILEQDPAKNTVAIAQLNGQLEDLELQHQQKMKQIDVQIAKDAGATWKGIFDSIGNTFGTVVQGLVKGTMTIGAAFKSLFGSVLQSLVGMLTQWAAKWAATQLANMVLGKTVAAAEVTTEVGKAGAGGVASMAAAPWPLNMTAPAFGAAMAAAAGAFGSVASAANGFDIPAGLNPLTQLHEREMVLPAEHADTIRSMRGMSGGDVHLHVHAMDSQSVKRLFSDNGAVLADVLKQQRRNFVF